MRRVRTCVLFERRAPGAALAPASSAVLRLYDISSVQVDVVCAPLAWVHFYAGRIHPARRYVKGVLSQDLISNATLVSLSSTQVRRPQCIVCFELPFWLPRSVWR